MAQYSGMWTLSQVSQAVKNQTWTGLPPSVVEYLIVAGGGGGGGAVGSSGQGGGGGAGGLLAGYAGITSGTSYTVTIGAGGTGSASSGIGGTGVSSVFSSITALGGGGGGTYSATTGVSGGSGGGSGGDSGNTAPAFGGAGTSGQGNAGGNTPQGSVTGGGGGAGTIGLSAVGTYSSSTATAGRGGAGIASSISGTVTTYAGGGGGSSNGYAGTGGIGGGGAGGVGSAVGTAGTANTGGGGGGHYNANNVAGAGGSGIVMVSYPDVYAAATSTTGSPTVSTSGSGSMVGAGGLGGNMIVYPATNNSSYAFGTSNFTIEFWFYTTSFAASPVLYDSRPSTVQGLYPTILTDSSGVIYYFTNSANQITGSTLSINTWYHVAVSRSGSSTKMFINGAQVGSTYTDTNTYLNAYPFMASSGFAIGSNYLPGAMTNVRVNNTTAVYTSNFTTPTAPLTAISGTVLLMSCNSGSYLTDSSASSSLIRTAGPAQWSSLSPFTGTGYKNRVYTWTSSGSITF
jgi:hypothetical protein